MSGFNHTTESVKCFHLPDSYSSSLLSRSAEFAIHRRNIEPVYEKYASAISRREGTLCERDDITCPNLGTTARTQQSGCDDMSCEAVVIDLT